MANFNRAAFKILSSMKAGLRRRGDIGEKGPSVIFSTIKKILYFGKYSKY